MLGDDGVVNVGHGYCRVLVADVLLVTPLYSSSFLLVYPEHGLRRRGCGNDNLQAFPGTGDCRCCHRQGLEAVLTPTRRATLQQT